MKAASCYWARVVLMGICAAGPAAAQIAVQPPYHTNYSLVDLGAVPGVLSSYGGLTFHREDPQTLLIGGNANTPSGKLYAISVVRGTNSHITGFSGTAAVFAEASNNDGGVVYGPGGVLFLARWDLFQVGQIKPGSTNTDKVIDLGRLGVTASPGGLNFVPAGFPGAGQFKIMGYRDAKFYLAALVPDGMGTFAIPSVTFETQISGGPEGFIYVPPGSPGFRDFNAMLVSEYQSGAITAYDLDANGAPVPGSRRVFISGLNGAEGAATDPLTGDFLFSTFGGGDRVIVVRGFSAPSPGTITPEDGHWSATQVILENTPEAELMVRVGDIDNLNFGWPAGFNPFSGRNTPQHAFPWPVDPRDSAGTDRILVVSSYQGRPPAGQDGYTSSTSRPANSVQPIVLKYTLNNRPVREAVLQMFADDFQAPVWRASYRVLLNGFRAPFLEVILNSLVQTGPIGKLLTVQIPSEYLPLIRSGSLEITIDDTTTGAGDGYAVDFVKLLINPRSFSSTGTIQGIVVDSSTQSPLGSALVSAAGLAEGRTDNSGRYLLADVPAGLVVVAVSRPGYATQIGSVDLVAGQSATLNFALAVREPPSITRQPQSQTVALGGRAVLNVIGAGTAPLRYQWKLNGVNLPGETNATLVVADFQLADSGRYRVTVANEAGAVTSQAAVLAPLNLTRLALTNNFSDRVTVTNPSRIGLSDNSGANRESGEPRHAGRLGGASVWLSFLSPVSGIATFTTAGSDFDTLLAIYTGNQLTGLNEVASDDDTAGFQTSLVRFNASAGTRYQVAVDGLGGAQGDVILSWIVEPTAVETVPLILGQPVSQTVGLGEEVRLEISVPGLGLSFQWFRNGVPVSGAANAFLEILNVRPGDIGQYFVRVSRGNRFVDSQTVALQINRSAIATLLERALSSDKFFDLIRALLNRGPALGALSRPGRMSLARGYSGTQIFSTFGSTSDEGEPNHCGVPGGASHWFAYQAEADGQLTLATDGSDFDTVLAVYTGPGTDFASLIPVACDNDSGLDGRDSRVSFPAARGTLYYVAVDGVNGATGTVELSYQLEAPSSLAWSSRSQGGLPGLKLSGQPGRTYRLEGSTNFLDWILFLTTNAPTGVLEFQDSAAPAFERRFYRAVVQP